MKVPFLLVGALLGGIYYITGVDPLEIALALLDMFKFVTGG